MAASRRVRIYGKQRKELDADVMVQVLILLGYELDKQEHQSTAATVEQDDGEGNQMDSAGGRS